MAADRNTDGLAYVAVIVCACLALPGCAPDPDGKVSGEDRRILQALVARACQLDLKQVVSDLPVTPYSATSKAPNVHFGLDLSQRKYLDARWPRKALCPTVRVRSDAVISAALKRENRIPPTWEHFRESFDGARVLLRISLPVYSPDGRRAVVYSVGTCPYTCGSGIFQELAKSTSGWTIVNAEIAWHL